MACKKAAQRSAKARPAPEVAVTLPEPAQEPKAPAAAYGVSPVDGLGLVYEDSMGNRLEREQERRDYMNR